ncbi:MAG: formylglycine-generating enzyme family protein [Myxococcales bacterium]|nr:formylglycine-generating enzyme family protein [Myxococcales bacterium]
MSAPSPTPYFDLDRFLQLARQVVAVGVREEERAYRLASRERPVSSTVLRAQLASLLAKTSEQSRQIGALFDECLSSEAPPDPDSRSRESLRKILRRYWTQLRPATRTTLLLALLLGMIGGVSVRLWPYTPHDPCVRDPAACKVDVHSPPSLPRPPQSSVRIVEDEPARVDTQQRSEPAEIPARSWLALCALSALLLLLGVRWLLLPGRLRHLQMQTQRAAEAALAREARARGEVLRPSYRVDPILPVPRSVAEDCATLLGRLRDEGRGTDLDVLRTLFATVRAGGRFTAVHTPRSVGGELLVFIDDEGRDHPWLSSYFALIEHWQRQGVRLAVYTYPEEFPHFLDPYPRVGLHSQPLADVVRQHAGSVLLILSRRLSPDGFCGEHAWTHELAQLGQCAWVDADPRSAADLAKARTDQITRLQQLGIPRYPLSPQGLLSMVRHLTNKDETPPQPELAWTRLPRLSSPKEQRALRLWATAAALVPDASWDQVRALQGALPEIHDVLPAPDTRSLFRLLEWVGRESGENPESGITHLHLSQSLQDRLVSESRREFGPPDHVGSFENRVHRILLGQLGDAPRAPEQQQGRGRLIWELKVAMHQALLYPGRALELLSRFVGTGVAPLLAAYLRNEQARQRHSAVFAGATWSNFGSIVSQAGRVSPRDLLLGARRTWGMASLCALLCVSLASLLVYAPLPTLRAWLRPNVTHTVEVEIPAESHVERVETKLPALDIKQTKPTKPAEPEKPPKLPATPQRPALVWIPPGSFTMGSPESEEGRDNDEKQHRVTLTRGLYVMETEVTQGQYKAVQGNNPAASEKETSDSSECSEYGVGTTLPVHCVTWFETVRYANGLSMKEGLEVCYAINGDQVTWPKGVQCRGFRLLTEAEWEYAAWASMRTVYAGGNRSDEYLWYDENSGSSMHAVRTRRPNAWGLYDMSGNVWEWVWDWYTEEPWKLGDIDPVGPLNSLDRVSRGGSWANGAQYARVANRGHDDPGSRGGAQGFRLVRSFP